MSGYCGWSMSNNAVDAYGSGEMPKSKWTKAEILAALEDVFPCKVGLAKKLSVAALKLYGLTCTSWHHTGKMFNETDFYSLDEDFFENLQEKDVAELNEQAKPVKQETIRYKGKIEYLTWSGTRKHPKATENVAEGIIEEKGCFYVLFNSDGREILRKKMGSNGTRVTREDKE